MKIEKNIPFVSIALATYNGEKYLVEQLETLVNQTYKNLEIIVSDDGSTDGTLQILKNYAEKYSNFFVYKNEVAHGIKRNFENALKYCKGEYIAFSDQDDIWILDKIEKLVGAIGNYSLVYHDSLFVDENGKSLNKTFSTDLNCYSGYDARAFLFSNCVSGHALLVKKNILLEALPFPKAKHHDWWLAFRAADNGGVKFLDEILVHYRQHSNSQTDFLRLKEGEISTEKLKEIEKEDIEWYETCASAEGKHQPFFKKWCRIYKEKNKHIWDVQLFFLSVKSLSKLFYIIKKSKASIFVTLIKRSWGENTKAWFKSLKSKKNDE